MSGGDAKYSENVATLSQTLFEDLVQATKIANSLPTDEDYSYYASFRPFKNSMSDLSKRLLDLTQHLIQHEKPVDPPIVNSVDEMDDVTQRFEVVLDVVDRLYDKVDAITSEERNGKPKNNLFTATPQTKTITHGKDDTKLTIIHSNNVNRPQQLFEEKIDNSPTPFFPKIYEKPNAQVPLERMYAERGPDGELIKDLEIPPDAEGYPHPYDYELRHLQFMERQLLSVTEQMYLPLEETPYTWVDSLGALKEVAAKLDSVLEFAIDLEAHSYRSYQGFVCLMQVSTRNEDFLIDTLKLRAHMFLLNSSFTNPKIVKVLHGADSDIVWLQRDFGVYIVNMFDTGQASRVLEYPSYSLAYLLKFFCSVDADKKYQLADWRIRVLPAEMVHYAREDTHYLLYIYDRLKNELLGRGNEHNNLLHAVLTRSRDVCLRRYVKEGTEPAAHVSLYAKSGLQYNQQQFRVYTALFNWRNDVARREDESTKYVLPNYMLFKLAESPPTDLMSLLACCNPTPPIVRMHTADLLRIIQEAKREPLPEIQPPPPLSPYRQQQARMPPASFYPQQQQQQQQQQPQQLSASPSRNPYQQPQQNHLTPHSPANRASHAHTPSPVLSTEQLYKTAGWVDTDPPAIAEPGSPTRSLSPSSSPRLLSPSPRRNVVVVPLKASGLFGEEDGSANDDNEEEAEETAAQRTAAVIRASFQSGGLFSALPASALLVASTLKEPKPPSNKATSASSGTSSGKSSGDEAADDDSDGDYAQMVVSSAGEDNSNKSSVTQPPEESVPRSMAEIYKLSNLNRKRNKEKKKLKEDSIPTSTSPTPNTPSTSASTSTSTPSSSSSTQPIFPIATPALATVPSTSHNQTHAQVSNTGSSKSVVVIDEDDDVDGDEPMRADEGYSEGYDEGISGEETSTRSKRQRKKDAQPVNAETSADTIDFMREIGWIGEGGGVAAPQSSQTTATSAAAAAAGARQRSDSATKKKPAGVPTPNPIAPNGAGGGYAKSGANVGGGGGGGGGAGAFRQPLPQPKPQPHIVMPHHPASQQQFVPFDYSAVPAPSFAVPAQPQGQYYNPYGNITTSHNRGHGNRQQSTRPPKSGSGNNRPTGPYQPR